MRKYENVSISKLIPYKYNARTHSETQIEKISESIKEYGFINPVLIDQNYNILAGHGRILGAKLLGMTEVPCLFVEDLTETQKKAYIIADNKLSLDAGWDIDILTKELSELDNLNFNLELTGFSLDEIQDLELQTVVIDTVEEDDYDIDEALENITEPKAKLGDIYKLGNHRLICGDSTNEKTIKALMNGDKADMVFTDPPWNVNYGAIKEDNPQGYKPRTILNDFMGTEDFKEFMYNAFNCMNIFSKDGCMTYVVMSAQEWGNMMLTLAQNNYHWSSTIIWNKDRLVLSRKDYHTKYEPIWYGWKSGASRLCPLNDRTQSDVWDFERPSKSEEHPTMKPIELVSRAIENSSKIKDKVLDMFGGSGSTLIACEKLRKSLLYGRIRSKICRRYYKPLGDLNG